MAWGKLYLIILHNDEAVEEAAQDYKAWYKMDKQHNHSIFGDFDDECQLLTAESISALNKVTSVDKITVISHSNQDGSRIMVKGKGSFDGAGAAKYFYEAGVRKAGLITFKCCLLGKSRFLEEFREGCINKIEVGFLKGYLGETLTVRKWAFFGDLGPTRDKPYELIGGTPTDEAHRNAQENRYRAINGVNATAVTGREYRQAWDRQHIQ